MALDLRLRYAVASAGLAGPAHGLMRLRLQAARADRRAGLPATAGRRTFDLRQAAARRKKAVSAAEAVLTELTNLTEATTPWQGDQHLLLANTSRRGCFGSASPPPQWRSCAGPG